MSDSVWKKEISFRRKPKASAEPKPEAEKQSFWKKEISLGRKSKEEPEAAAPAAPPESLLKKEISFSRKPKEERAEKQSFWKKEISLGRKSKDEERNLAAPAQPKESFLKKEISFSRKKREREVERLAQEAAQSVARAFTWPAEPPVASPTELAEAAVAAMPDPEAVAPPAMVEPVPPAEPVAPVEGSFAPPVEPVAPAPLAVVPDPSPLAPLAAVPDPEPAPHDAVDVDAVPVLPVEEAAAVEQSLLPPFQAVPPVPPPLEPLSPTPELPEMPVAAQPAAPPALEQPPAPEPPPAAQPLETAAPEPWNAAPELPPAPAPVVHPPVPAAELPPLSEPKVPFYKKELSFSRKRREASAAPKPEVEQKPFWKKELSLSRMSGESKAPKQPKSRGGGHKAQRFVGLKVGASQLAAARVSNNGSTELLQVAREPLEPGIVVGGELRDPELLGQALKRFFAKTKMPRKNVRLGIASNRIGVRVFDVSGIGDDKQLENAIHFRAQEALPIPLDEAVLDYHVLDESVDDEGNATKRILLVVAYRELVDRYLSACRKAGISLVGIDLEAFALLRALSAPRLEGEASDAALVAVSIGHDRSTFAVSDGRICEFTRVLEWGGSTLSVAIARALNLAPSEVEVIKRMVSLESAEAPQGIAPDHYARAVDAVRTQVQSFARELVSSLQFYQNQPGSLGIGEIVITGGTASLAGLAEELQRLIGVRVRVGDPLARVKVSKKVATPEPVGSLAVAIGLGIED